MAVTRYRVIGQERPCPLRFTLISLHPSFNPSQASACTTWIAPMSSACNIHMDPTCREMKAMPTWVGKKKMPGKQGLREAEGPSNVSKILRRAKKIWGFIHRCHMCLQNGYFENVPLIWNIKMLAAIQQWQFTSLSSNDESRFGWLAPVGRCHNYIILWSIFLHGELF